MKTHDYIAFEDKLIQKSAKIGEYLTTKLKTIKSNWINEIRGKGLLFGLKLTANSGVARKFCEALAKERILCKETHDYVIRFAPPLTISKKKQLIMQSPKFKKSSG